MSLKPLNKKKILLRELIVGCVEKKPQIPTMPSFKLRAFSHILRMSCRRIDKSEKPSSHSLQSHYDKLVKTLNEQYPDSYRTTAEKYFLDNLKSKSRLKLDRSFWIGNRNVDLFTPSVKTLPDKESKQSKGVVIEIDGPIHNKKFKICRDEHLGGFLKNFSLPIMSVPNHELHQPVIINFVNKLSKLPKTNHFERSSLYRDIFWKTILTFVSDRELSSILKFKIDETIFSLVSELYKNPKFYDPYCSTDNND